MTVPTVSPPTSTTLAAVTATFPAIVPKIPAFAAVLPETAATFETAAPAVRALTDEPEPAAPAAAPAVAEPTPPAATLTPDAPEPAAPAAVSATYFTPLAVAVIVTVSPVGRVKTFPVLSAVADAPSYVTS